MRQRMKEIEITSEEASVAGTALVNTAGEKIEGGNSGTGGNPAEPETTVSPLSDGSETFPVGGLLDKLLALTQGKMDERQAEEIHDALVLYTTSSQTIDGDQKTAEKLAEKLEDKFGL